MLAWLSTYFSVEAGVIATAIKAGDVVMFLSDDERIRGAVLAIREALTVVGARGVNPRSVPDVQVFSAPEGEVARTIRGLYASGRAARLVESFSSL